MTNFKVPKLIMLCGIPTSGKSTYVQKLQLEDYILLSTDNYIEQMADHMGLTYNTAFDGLVGEATKDMERRLKLAVRNDLSIVWDQTNLTPSARKRKLSKVPLQYEKTAVWFDIPLEEAMIRNQQRPGKVIPGSVLKQMFRTFVPPTTSEGFDLIIKAN